MSSSDEDEEIPTLVEAGPLPTAELVPPELETKPQAAQSSRAAQAEEDVTAPVPVTILTGYLGQFGK